MVWWYEKRETVGVTRHTTRLLGPVHIHDRKRKLIRPHDSDPSIVLLSFFRYGVKSLRSWAPEKCLANSVTRPNLPHKIAMKLHAHVVDAIIFTPGTVDSVGAWTVAYLGQSHRWYLRHWVLTASCSLIRIINCMYKHRLQHIGLHCNNFTTCSAREKNVNYMHCTFIIPLVGIYMCMWFHRK